MASAVVSAVYAHPRGGIRVALESSVRPRMQPGPPLRRSAGATASPYMPATRLQGVSSDLPVLPYALRGSGVGVSRRFEFPRSSGSRFRSRYAGLERQEFLRDD